MSTKRFFIVNPAGAIHEVTEDHARELLAKVGYRNASAADVKKLNSQRGNLKPGEQRFDEPICEPFTATPEPVEVEGLDEATPAPTKGKEAA